MPNLFADLPSLPASISSIDGVNVSENMQRNLVNNAMRGAFAMIKTNFAGSANTITASAGTFTLASISAGDYVLMAPPSGGSITSFGAASDGLTKYLESLGTVVLRNGASLSVQGNADLTLVAGDVVWCRRDQSIWKARIQKADGGAITTGTAAIANNSVTYAKMQDISAASRLLGRGSSGGSGDPQEISLGSGLSMSGTTLSATSSGSSTSVTAAHFQDQRASGTDGGTATTGAWTNRTLNTTVTNGITGMSLASNTVTCPAGTYVIWGDGSFSAAQEARNRLRNTSDGSTIALGIPSDTGIAQLQGSAVVMGIVTFATAKNVTLQYWVDTSTNTQDLGVPVTTGDVEVYGNLMFLKIA